MDIKEFLLARIAEDENYAYHALGLLGVENAWWTWAALKGRFPGLSRADAQHIERHGPRRVMAECAAKRGVIKGCTAVDGWQDEYAVGLRDDTLQSLATVYSGHPEYQQEWSL